MKYTDLILDWYREEIECVPRPTGEDKLKLAIKACIIERLVEVFNSPPHNRNKSVPAWCKDINGLEKPVYLQSRKLLEGERYCATFEKRNLLVTSNFMFFV